MWCLSLRWCVVPSLSFVLAVRDVTDEPKVAKESTRLAHVAVQETTQEPKVSKEETRQLHLAAQETTHEPHVLIEETGLARAAVLLPPKITNEETRQLHLKPSHKTYGSSAQQPQVMVAPTLASSIATNESDRGSTSATTKQKQLQQTVAEAVFVVAVAAIVIIMSIIGYFGFRLKAWFIAFLCLVGILVRAPLAMCSKSKAKGLADAWFLLRFCLEGLDPWIASCFIILGVQSFSNHRSCHLCTFSVPSEQIDKDYPVEKIRDPYMSAVLGYDFYIGSGDYDMWIPPWILVYVRRVFRFVSWFYPDISSGKKPVTAEEQQRYAQQLTDHYANPQIVPCTPLIEPNTSAGVERFCILGFGAGFLQRDPEGDGYMVDMSFLEDLPVREGFSEYGGKIALDKNMKFEYLWLQGRKWRADEANFDAAMYILRMSCSIVAVGVHHVLWCHYFSAGHVALVSRTHLPASHPLRRVLSIFTIGSISVNEVGATEVISNIGAVLHRYTGFTHSSNDRLFQMGMTGMFGWRFQTYAEELRKRGVSGLPREQFPYGHFGMKLCAIYESFADTYVDHYWNDDASVKQDKHLQAFFQEYNAMFPPGYDGAPPAKASTKSEVSLLISHHMWIVTAVHEQSGRSDQIWDYGLGCSMAAKRTEGGLSLDNILPSYEARIATFLIQALVHSAAPKLLCSVTEDMHRFLLDDCPVAITSQLHADLWSLCAEIDIYNETATDSLIMLDPRELEVSVFV